MCKQGSGIVELVILRLGFGCLAIWREIADMA